MRLKIPEFSREIARFGDWTLYQLQDDGSHSFLWVQMRLQLPVDTPKRRGKARAYRLAWNPLAARFARSRDSAGLEREHPGLYFDLGLYLSTFYDRAWLLDPEGAGVTEADIGTEITRLSALQAKRRAAKRATAPAREVPPG